MDISSLKSIYSGGGAILVIDYFGVIDCEETIKKIKIEMPDSFVILDIVQAPFLITKPTNADVSFTSLRKALPVPDGGIVHLKGQKLQECTAPSRFAQYKIAASYLKK